MGNYELGIWLYKERECGSEKSYAFALRMVRMYKHLTEQRKEFLLSKQVLRSGTSIGGQSDKDFVANNEHRLQGGAGDALLAPTAARFWLRRRN